jgi:hypothetical protein
MTCRILANADISGIGVRIAIYLQNLLSFVPAIWALLDGEVTEKELETMEKQASTILIMAFALLISTVVQLGTYSLSGFHTSIILSLSWMNNTNTFIYFLLYIHHKSDERRGRDRVELKWSRWLRHMAQPIRFVRAMKVDGENQSHTDGQPDASHGRPKLPNGDVIDHYIIELVKNKEAKGQKHIHTSSWLNAPR